MNESSIYDDLNSTDLGTKVLELQQQNGNLRNHIESLEKDVQKLCKELVQMKKIEENLKRNISELYKTAKSEIERKDRMIAELRRELESLLFRRKNRFMSDPNRKIEVTFSTQSNDRYNNKRSNTDVYSEHEPINKRVKCEQIDETPNDSVSETKFSVKLEDDKDRMSRSSSSSYGYDRYRSRTRSRERDGYRHHTSDSDRDRHITNNKENVQSHKSSREKFYSSNKDNRPSRSRSKGKDRHRNARSRTKSRDRNRQCSSNKESSRRHDKNKDLYRSSNKNNPECLDKNYTKHDYKNHSKFKDGNKVVSEIKDQDNKKPSNSKDVINCKNNSNISNKNFKEGDLNNSKSDNRNVESKTVGLGIIKNEIIEEHATINVTLENENEIQEYQTDKNGDNNISSHIQHSEDLKHIVDPQINSNNLDNKDITSKLSKGKNKEGIYNKSENVTKSLCDTETNNLNNITSVKLEENHDGKVVVTNNLVGIVTQPIKNEGVPLEENHNNSMNNSCNSTDASPNTREEVNLGQNQSNRIKLNARRRRCVIKIVN